MTFIATLLLSLFMLVLPASASSPAPGPGLPVPVLSEPSLPTFTGNPAPADPEKRTLSVSAQGQVELPADRIQFHVNLNAEAESPQRAYEVHKEREEVLVNLLREFDFSEEDIHYEPISISRRNNHPQREQQPTFQTSQRVRLMISDFSIYEQMQVRLIENGYDSFSGSFMSSKAEEGKKQAIEEAIRQAKERAQFIAQQADLELGPVQTINYHEAPPTPQYARASATISLEADLSLSEFDQTVTISASVSINYEIKEVAGN